MLAAGQVPTGQELDALFAAGSVIARGSRSSGSTAAAGAQGVLRVDGVALTGGRRYYVRTNSLILTSSVANDRVTARLSMNTSGAAAVTGDPIYALVNTLALDSTTDGTDGQCAFNYTPAVDQVVSIILWTQRLAGTGNARLVVTGGTTIDIDILDCSLDPGDSGIAL